MRIGKKAIKRIGVTLAATAAATGATVVAGVPAQAAGEWCNNWVCIETYDTGTYLGRVELNVWSSSLGGTVTGRVWTTNGWSARTKTETVGKFTTYRGYVYPQRHFPSGTRLCGEGWLDGRSVGLPCVTIRA
ncbi:hypothetical protein E1281_26165 [Actinomadura sp. KC345]|uniref:hypothetical protein n=1 Tax=Actinomadura sp. KC345 TaxID=2530371 RepID=UPI0010514A2F|nr:hypothetical protein [Actinomadura sp. KC345]TDC47525.1 hypothetical protein E1281_26165 [Actinomadura sp. KC345]